MSEKIRENGTRKWVWPIFTGLMVSAIVITFISMRINYAGAVNSMFFQWFTDTYMDFFNCVAEDRSLMVYTVNHSIYPPLMNMMYLVISRFLPVLPARELAASAEGLKLYLTIQILCSVAFLYGVWLNTRGLKDWQRFLTAVVSALSLPLIFSFERGNSIVLVCALILFFIRLYRSENKWLRLLGLFLLAVAANMKFWPALFGLVLVREKRWKDAGICVAFGVILFAVPMMFYEGIRTLPIILENFANASRTMNAWGLGYKINWGNFFDIIERAFGLQVPGFAVNLMAALTGICAVITKKRSGIFLGVALICAAFPAFSYNYSGLYLFAPVCAILEDRKNGKIDLVYIALLAFAAMPIGIDCLSFLYPLSLPNEGQHLNISTVVSATAVFLLSVTFIVNTAVQVIRDRKIRLFPDPDEM